MKESIYKKIAEISQEHDLRYSRNTKVPDVDDHDLPGGGEASASHKSLSSSFISDISQAEIIDQADYIKSLDAIEEVNSDENNSGEMKKARGRSIVKQVHDSCQAKPFSLSGNMYADLAYSFGRFYDEDEAD